jgi:hypothetical protein
MGILSLEWIGLGDADAVELDENDRRSICKVKDRRWYQPGFAAGPSTKSAIDAHRAWCKSQMSRIYSVLLRLNNGPHA